MEISVDIQIQGRIILVLNKEDELMNVCDQTFKKYYRECLMYVESVNCLWADILLDYELRLIPKKNLNYGWCQWSGVKFIELNTYKLGFQDVAEIKDTILHEMAHAIHAEFSGSSDHSPEWRKYARAIGANPRATGKPCKAPKEYKYVIVAVDDGEIFGSFKRYLRKPRLNGWCIGEVIKGWYMTDHKELTKNRLKVIPWEEWTCFCDSYGIDYDTRNFL